MADAISIEQHNKIRAALGLKPLPVPGEGPSFKKSNGDSSDEEPASTIETREAAASGNWQKLQDEAAAKKKREERNAAIKKARDIAQRNAKLEGTTLGESADADMDTKSWLLGTKKKQKSYGLIGRMHIYRDWHLWRGARGGPRMYGKPFVCLLRPS